MRTHARAVLFARVYIFYLESNGVRAFHSFLREDCMHATIQHSDSTRGIDIFFPQYLKKFQQKREKSF